VNILLDGKRLAIIVGIDKYKDSRIYELEGARYDSQELKTILEKADTGKFEIYHLFGQDATSQNIRKALSDIFWQTDYYDIVMFYFSGHGFKDSYDNGYIAPYDMIVDEPFVCGINMKELNAVISQSKNKQVVIMILDCCFSGIATRGDRAILESISKQQFEEGIELSGQGRIVLASGGKDQKSKETLECKHLYNSQSHPHGKFTFHLIEALEGKGETNDNGVITLEKIQKYIMKEMSSEDQIPKISINEGSLLDNIEIAVSPQKLDQIRALKIEIEGLLETGGIRSLHDATKKVVTLQNLTSDDNEIKEYKIKIDLTLKPYKGRIIDWLVTNEGVAQPRIDRDPLSKGRYSDLYDVENYLEFEEFSKIDNLYLSYLSTICDVIERKRDINQFINRITACIRAYKNETTKTNMI
jgi:hypothetical protein